MHFFRGIRVALLCGVIVAVLAACGSSNQVQPNYGSLANAVCGKFIDKTQGTITSAERIQALEDTLSGLQNLHPPQSVEALYVNLLYHFKSAVDILKAKTPTLARLAKRLNAHPGDKVAGKQYALIVKRIQFHLKLASARAHTLALGRCQVVFGG